MKRKLLIALLTLLSISACAFGFSACLTPDGGETNSGGETPHEHVYGGWQIITPVSCVTDGVKKQSCYCGDIKTEIIPATKIHNYVDYVCTGCNAFAPDAPVTEGLEYTLHNGEYSVWSFMSGILSTAKTIIIPSEYNGLPVTSIDSGAFGYYTSLTNIKIPDSITSIGIEAFSDCTSLKNVNIPDSVTFIGDEAFRNCTSLKYNEYDNGLYLGNNINPYHTLVKASSTDIKSCAINSQTKVIYSSSFENCTSLTSITIPDNVTFIGGTTFKGCTSLTSLTIPYNVTSIGTRTFDSCTSLTSIIIPDTVTSIGDYAFYNCTSLTSIPIPNGVTYIGYYAFCQSTSLTSLTIPNSVTFIGNSAFYKCSSLKYNEYDNGLYLGNEINPYFTFVKASSTDIKSCTINSKTKTIHCSAFQDCTSLTGIIIPEGVTSIGATTFKGCSSLTDITIPDSVTSIGDAAFENCSVLESIKIPDGVGSIERFIFFGCSSLTSITIPNSVNYIDYRAFYESSSLADVMFEGTKEQWNAIRKSYGWNDNTGDYTIHCSDGDIKK